MLCHNRLCCGGDSRLKLASDAKVLLLFHKISRRRRVGSVVSFCVHGGLLTEYKIDWKASVVAVMRPCSIFNT